MPLPNTRVIGDDWSTHHRPTVEATLTGSGTLTRATGNGAGPWNPATGQVGESAAGVLYVGPARAQARTTNAVAREAAGQDVATREYLIVLTADAPAIRAGEFGDVFTFTECPDDPHLVGRALRVVDVLHGTQRFERDLICVDDLSVNNP